MKLHKLFELDELIMLLKDRQMEAFHNMVKVRGMYMRIQVRSSHLGYGRSQEVPPA